MTNRTVQPTPAKYSFFSPKKYIDHLMGHKTNLSKLQGGLGRGREREKGSCHCKMVTREIPILKLFYILNVVIATQIYDKIS